MSRAYVLGVFLMLGCGTSATGASEPAPEESFTMTTAPPPDVAPASTEAEEVFGPPPWLGRLMHTTHHYWNGCTDHREVELISLARGGTRIPIILGWRRISPRHREEPQFLTAAEQLSASVRGHACVIVTGSVVSYAHQGISGAPAYAIAASHITPGACP